jgi:hypothetical protein
VKTGGQLVNQARHYQSRFRDRMSSLEENRCARHGAVMQTSPDVVDRVLGGIVLGFHDVADQRELAIFRLHVLLQH